VTKGFHKSTGEASWRHFGVIFPNFFTVGHEDFQFLQVQFLHLHFFSFFQLQGARYSKKKCCVGWVSSSSGSGWRGRKRDSPSAALDMTKDFLFGDFPNQIRNKGEGGAGSSLGYI